MAHTQSAQALTPLETVTKDETPSKIRELAVLDVRENRRQDDSSENKPEPVKYKVQEDDSLSKIAKRYDTSWRRLFDKNTHLEHPDIIKVDETIVIPKEDEELEERELPSPPITTDISQEPSRSSVPQPSSTAEQSTASSRSVSSTSTARGSASGNLYTYGYCTWHVKNLRPDLPNNLGNANTWVARARAQGLPTGSTPRVGAVGQQGMHVVYVKQVHNNGTVTVSEMNFKGWNVTSSRTVAASNFTYIY
ncbi:MAG: LysM peptidoglycan-binding domain-containing protein [Candidatus Saccharibacteria bacterium]|nr:LysM peptidoglycan-binding domain-containing protein [Candidatus Saccharibacteria bacterium]